MEKCTYELKEGSVILHDNEWKKVIKAKIVDEYGYNIEFEDGTVIYSNNVDLYICR